MLKRLGSLQLCVCGVEMQLQCRKEYRVTPSHSPKGWFGEQFVGALWLDDDGREVTLRLLDIFIARLDYTRETVLLLYLLGCRDI